MTQNGLITSRNLTVMEETEREIVKRVICGHLGEPGTSGSREWGRGDLEGSVWDRGDKGYRGRPRSAGIGQHGRRAPE